MIDDDPMRYAKRLNDEAWCVFHSALEPLNAGDGAGYDARATKAAGLIAAARWAAAHPEVGADLLRDHGLELPEREAPTTRIRRLPEPFNPAK